MERSIGLLKKILQAWSKRDLSTDSNVFPSWLTNFAKIGVTPEYVGLPVIETHFQIAMMKLNVFPRFSSSLDWQCQEHGDQADREDPPGQPDQAGEVAPWNQIPEQAPGHHERGLPGHEDSGLCKLT